VAGIVWAKYLLLFASLPVRTVFSLLFSSFIHTDLWETITDAKIPALGISEPEIFISVKNNKMACAVGLFIINSVGHNMLSTGAFEIYVNDELVYSKLALRKMPDAQDIAQALAIAGFK
jgi:selT/selW/selH-like putative selenoprotein